MLRTTINAPIWLQIQAFRLQFVEKITIRQRKIPYYLIHYKSTFWSLKQESTPIISGKNSVVFYNKRFQFDTHFAKFTANISIIPVILLHLCQTPHLLAHILKYPLSPDFGRGQKEKEQTTIGMICSLLPWKDSNPHRRNQNPECYHYTTRHFGTAKLLLFFDMAIQNHLFFQKKFITDTKFLSK